MEKEKLGQNPAFACMYGTSENGYLQEGISKRFYAACCAMKGILSAENEYRCYKSDESLIRAAYEYADELLKQENE